MSKSLANGTALASVSTRDSILCIAEILDRVLSFNDVNDAARCARVCKAWKDTSLDHVWHTLTSVMPLFSILAPLRTTVEGLVFERQITPSDWLRFYPIANRVKNIEMPSLLETVQLPNGIAVADLLISRPKETVILPNLKRLRVRAAMSSLSWASMLLHKGLEHFLLETKVESPETIIHEFRILELLTYRVPDLKTLEIYITEEVSGSALATLASTLSRQRSLEVLWLTSGTLTTLVLNSVSHLPKLKQLSLDDNFGTGEYEAVKTLVCNHIDGEKCFPSLTGLGVQTRVVSVTSLIQTHTSFAQLEILHIDMVFHNSAEDIRRCLETISSTCQKLKSLFFTRTHDEGDRPEVLEQETDPITKETLATLPSFHYLKKFWFEHTQPITITDDDLIGLLGGCPSLTCLCLNPSPVKEAALTASLPSLGVLHRIAHCCPRLEELSIYLDATDSFDLDLPYNFGEESQLFEKLETMRIGKSAINDVKRVAIYLSQVLPLGCDLELPDETDQLFNSRWKEVKEWLPSLIIMSSEQRQQKRALMEEVDILNAKLASLGE